MTFVFLQVKDEVSIPNETRTNRNEPGPSYVDRIAHNSEEVTKQ